MAILANGLKLTAIVLAGGQSRRMGTNKLLLPLPDGRTMLAHSVDHVLASGLSPIIVVTGHEQAAVHKTLRGREVNFVHATDFDTGMSASLRTGIRHVPPDAEAVLVCLGDMPLVSAAIVNQLVAAFSADNGHDIIIPCFQGQRGNPVIVGRRHFSELDGLEGDTGAKQIFARHGNSILEVSVQSDAVLRDYDTPEAFESLAKWTMNSAPTATSASAISPPNAADDFGQALPTTSFGV
jgi:molybdenum cofactor cytidylyltransferase